MAVTYNQSISSLQITDFHLLDVEQNEKDPMFYFEKSANSFRSRDSTNGLRYWEKAMSLASLAQQKEFMLTFNNLRRFHGHLTDNGQDIAYTFVRATDQERLRALEIFLFSRIVNVTAQTTLFDGNNLINSGDDLKERVHLPEAGNKRIGPTENKRLEFIISCTRQLLLDCVLSVVPGGLLTSFLVRRSVDTLCDFYTAPVVHSFVSNSLDTLRPKGPIIIKA